MISEEKAQLLLPLHNRLVEFALAILRGFRLFIIIIISNSRSRYAYARDSPLAIIRQVCAILTGDSYRIGNFSYYSDTLSPVVHL